MGKYEKGQIDDILDELLDFTGDRTRELAQTITVTLAKETPRDTSLAASSWVASPVSSTPGRVPSRNPAGVAKARTAQGQSLVRLGNYKIEHGQIFIGNPVRYIEDLAQGSSPQARDGYVQRTAIKAVIDANRKK